MTLDIIKIHTQNMNQYEERFSQMDKGHLFKQEFVQLYMEFVPAYSVAKKMFSSMQGMDDLQSDFVLSSKKITVPSPTELIKHEHEAMLFIGRVHAFADKIEAVRKQTIGSESLIPDFLELILKEKTQQSQEKPKNPNPNQRYDNEGVSFLKPGFLLSKK